MKVRTCAGAPQHGYYLVKENERGPPSVVFPKAIVGIRTEAKACCPGTGFIGVLYCVSHRARRLMALIVLVYCLRSGGADLQGYVPLL